MKKIIILFILLIGLSSWKQESTVQRKKHFKIEKGIAVGGYDPVAYFTHKKGIKGKTNYPYTYKGVKYLFSSNKNLSLFKSNPKKYEPAYGGWCAYAMGQKGEKVEVNYQTFKIQNGRLMLFYNKYFNNTLETWEEKGAEAYENKANKNWSKIIAQ